jgi:hypothetical protein
LRRKVVTALIILIIFLPDPLNVACCGYPLEPLILGRINGHEIYDMDKDLEDLTVNPEVSGYAFRVAGSRGAEAAAEWIESHLNSYGLNSHREAFIFNGWDLEARPRLIVDVDGILETEEDRVEIGSFMPLHLSWPTPPNGILAELTWVNNLAGFRDLKNRVVILDRDMIPLRLILSRMASERPAAIIYTWSRPGLPPVFYSAEGRLYWDLEVPVGWVSYEDGIILKGLSGRGVLANITVNALIGDVVHHNIIGELGGLDATRVIIVSAHYDTVMTPGFMDNGAGIVGLLGIARALSDAVKDGVYIPPCRILFIAFAAEEYSLVGSLMYVESHKAELGRIMAVLNIDSIGSSELRLASSGDDLKAEVSRSAKELGIPIGMEAEVESDHLSFAEPERAEGLFEGLWPGHHIYTGGAEPRPAVTFASYPLFYDEMLPTGDRGWIHTPRDSYKTGGWANPRKLEDQVKVIALTLMRLLSRLEGTMENPLGITCVVEPSNITIGDEVTVMGSVNPPGRFHLILTYMLNGGDAERLSDLVTNSTGEYAFKWTPLKPGNYVIKVVSQGNVEARSILSVKAKPLISNVKIKVFDESGRPLPEASIELKGQDHVYYGLSNPSGEAFFQVPEGEYEVATKFKGSTVSKLKVNLNAHVDEELTLRCPVYDLDIEVELVIYPLESALVKVDDSTAITDGNGIAHFDQLPAGTYSIEVYYMKWKITESLILKQSTKMSAHVEAAILKKLKPLLILILMAIFIIGLTVTILSLKENTASQQTTNYVINIVNNHPPMKARRDAPPLHSQIDSTIPATFMK